MASLSNSPAAVKGLGSISKRRILGDIPNAVNSPRRPPAASKRNRLDPEAKEDFDLDVQRPAKRQALTNKLTEYRTPRRTSANIGGEAIFEDSQVGRPTAFERKLIAAKNASFKQSQPSKQVKQARSEEQALEGLRAWQRNTRRAFPSFVFYFEGLPDDTRRRYSKQLKALGAREERFFSREITHVVTNRALPGDKEETSPTDEAIVICTESAHGRQIRTIAPALLERQRGPNLDSLRPSLHNGDILARAKEMGMKVWQLEKLHRVFQTLLDERPDVQATQGRSLRRTADQAGQAGEGDLSRLLRKEQLNGPLDRDNNSSLEEQIAFKGPYLYVRCLDEKTKPILLKEYPRVSKKDEGVWPRLHATRAGRCPFIEDPDFQDGTLQKSAEGKSLRRSQRKQDEAKTKLEKESRPQIGRRPLAESQNAGNRQPVQPEKLPQMGFCVPPLPNHKHEFGTRKPMLHFEGNTMVNGEPAASGVQPSNITSAIRSQMISSTAAAPGAKAPTSREVFGLKRRVLEKNCGGQAAPNSIQVAQRKPQAHNPARAEAAIPTREARTRAQQKQLVCVEENSTQSAELSGEPQRQQVVQQLQRCQKPSNKSKLEMADSEKPLKPGYCENCREKYEDFDSHVVSKRHREFALNHSNWTELDRLLDKLDRPLKINTSNIDPESSF